MAEQAEPDRRGATLTRYAEIVHTALIEMRGTTSPRLVLELLCARMLLPDAATDSAALLQRIERLERRVSAATAVAVRGAGPVDGAGGDAARPRDRACAAEGRGSAAEGRGGPPSARAAPTG